LVWQTKSAISVERVNIENNRVLCFHYYLKLMISLNILRDLLPLDMIVFGERIPLEKVD
jgi:hypothetical protein